MTKLPFSKPAVFMLTACSLFFYIFSGYAEEQQYCHHAVANFYKKEYDKAWDDVHKIVYLGIVYSLCEIHTLAEVDKPTIFITPEIRLKLFHFASQYTR